MVISATVHQFPKAFTMICGRRFALLLYASVFGHLFCFEKISLRINGHKIFQGNAITPDDFPKIEQIIKCAVRVSFCLFGKI